MQQQIGHIFFFLNLNCIFFQIQLNKQTIIHQTILNNIKDCLLHR